MKINYFKYGFFILFAILLIGAVGDTFRSVMINSTGVVQQTPILSSNQISIVAAPSSAEHIVRFSDIISSTKGGTGTNTTLLPGVWTNNLGMIIGSDALTSSTTEGTTVMANFSDIALKVRSLTADHMGSVGLYNSNNVLVATLGVRTDTTNLVFRTHFTGSAIILKTGNAAGVDTLTVSNYLATVYGNLTVTNNANAKGYQVSGVQGFTAVITNVGVGFTNVEAFAQGLLTNKFTIP